ncbi:MAG: Periplasmic binding protein [Betaproteobacteria bacterium]|nr:Periplasmic binding protein [Betaproteobacteria bacterium]
MTSKGAGVIKMMVLALSASVALSGAAYAQTIKTAVDATFAPHAMVKMGGGLEGFNIDLGNEIAKRLGKPIDIEGTQFSGLIPGLNAKKYDFILAPTTVTKERADALLFTEGYLDTDYLFVQKKTEGDIKGLDALKGKTITVNKGSAYENWAKDNMAKYGYKYDVYDTNADAVQAVLSGRADANLAGNTVAQWAAKQNPLLKTSYLIKTGLVWAIPFRKDDTEGRAKVSMVIKCMKLDGTIGKFHEKWFGAKAAPDSSAMKPVAGTGVPGMTGYDPTPVTPKCS